MKIGRPNCRLTTWVTYSLFCYLPGDLGLICWILHQSNILSGHGTEWRGACRKRDGRLSYFNNAIWNIRELLYLPDLPGGFIGGIMGLTGSRHHITTFQDAFKIYYYMDNIKLAGSDRDKFLKCLLKKDNFALLGIINWSWKKIEQEDSVNYLEYKLSLQRIWLTKNKNKSKSGGNNL